ncbi:hypothetical protein [Cellvibrio sp. UBA7671]|uniref:hypothetical protein n=1 Tax=Cellvibrio sp. UBA7671 TaxID=1946312 RepID=UPI002F35602A
MTSHIANLFSPKGLDYYQDLTRDMKCSIDVTRDESAAVLKAYDRGVDVLNQDELQLLNSVIAKLKDVIHP